MRKYLKIIIASLIITLSLVTFSCASDKKLISSVAVTGIDAPYSESRVLDTSGTVAYGEPYRITDIAWKSPSSETNGYYEVTITLKANKYYAFSIDTVGTVNGDAIKGKRLINEEEFSITYAFDENSSTASSIGNATSTTRYRITVYCDTEKGSITPSLMRVLKGKDQTVTITPNEGYKIKDVKVDGESVGAVSEYTFKKVKENHTIRAYFEKIEETEINTEENKPLLKLLHSILEAFNA